MINTKEIMSRRKQKIQLEAEVIIDYLNERGYGVAKYEGKEVHILNALPGEKVRISIFKKRKGIHLAHVLEILERAKYRLDHKEEHYLSCSPWQIMPIQKENGFKKVLIQGFFSDNQIKIPDFEVISDEKEYGYRNKVELSFYGHEDDHLTFAFHTRESGFHKIPADSCVLLPDKINKSANEIIKFLNQSKVTARQLKGLLLRYSFFEDKVIAAVFVKDPGIRVQNLESLDLESLQKDLKGFLIIHSDFRSPAFVETDILYKHGDLDLEEKVSDKRFIYPYNGFFQVNPPVFGKAVEDMIDFVKCIENAKDLTAADIYAGVGSIGLCLAPNLKKVIGVEITPTTKYYADLNAKNNNIDNFEFFEGKAEIEGLKYIESADILILDPPRSGLHPKVVSKILETRPKYIIYLSCNPKTQSENLKDIMQHYVIKFFRAYNFYPHTPHVENLMIMERS